MQRKPHPDDWKPNPGPQTRFLSLTCREALYGGSAGGGKSQALLVDAIRYVGRGHGRAYRALLLRRTFPDLEKSLIEDSHELYPRIGGSYNQQSKRWRFPGGESVWFGYLDHEQDVRQYQSAAFAFIGFDELTHFTERQYLYMFSRCRCPAGIPLRIRAGTNPGSEGHDWVFKRWGAWLDPESTVAAEPGQVLHYYRDEEGQDTLSDRAHPLAMGRTFIPARVSDNPFLAQDGEYLRMLQNLQLVERSQLRDGDWLIKPAPGLYFKRHYFQIVGAPPAEPIARIRYWDRASTGESEAVKRKKTDPDYTVGLKLSKTAGGIYYVEDVVRLRGNPGEVKRTIKQTAELDGTGVIIGLEQDPASAGQFEIDEYKTYLDGWFVKSPPARQDKITRAGPASTQAEVGNVRIVQGPWNKSFIEELEAFPSQAHDDQVDAFSGAHNLIASGVLPSSVKPKQPTRESVFGGDGGW